MKGEHPADGGGDSAFLPTSPPPLEPNLEFALVLVRLGVKTLQVSLIDLVGRSCEKSWNINELGRSALVDVDNSFDASFPTAMGSIAQLEHTPAVGTLTRQLGPRLWAYAWRVDDRRVAVAEAYFRLAHSGLVDADTATLRDLCEAGLGLKPPAPAAEHPAADRPMAPSIIAGGMSARHAPGETRAVPTGHTPLEPLEPVESVESFERKARATGRSSGPSRAGLLVLLLLSIAAAAIFANAYRQTDSAERELLRLRGQAEAVMSLRLGEMLRGGDYGEVQAELDAFAALKYFDRALVTNPQHRAIAMVGRVDGARIGNVVPATASAGARVVALNTAGLPPGAELMTWDAPSGSSPRPAAQRVWLLAGLVLSLVAAGAAAWMLLRQAWLRRAGARQDDPTG
jgi:hypothetical protein